MQSKFGMNEGRGPVFVSAQEGRGGQSCLFSPPFGVVRAKGGARKVQLGSKDNILSISQFARVPHTAMVLALPSSAKLMMVLEMAKTRSMLPMEKVSLSAIAH